MKFIEALVITIPLLFSFDEMIFNSLSHFSGRGHLREALVLHEESQRLQRMCRELKGKATFGKVLKKAQDATLEVFRLSGDEDGLQELLDPPHIIGTYLEKC